MGRRDTSSQAQGLFLECKGFIQQITPIQVVKLTLKDIKVFLQGEVLSIIHFLCTLAWELLQRHGHFLSKCKSEPAWHLQGLRGLL